MNLLQITGVVYITVLSYFVSNQPDITVVFSGRLVATYKNYCYIVVLSLYSHLAVK